MKIDDSLISNSNTLNAKLAEKDIHVKAQEKAIEKKDTYVPAIQKDDNIVIYDKPKVNQAVVAKLRADSERIYSNLRAIVEELLQRQGMTLQDVGSGKSFFVDGKAKADALSLISDGGELSAESVSNRIIAFAKAISGGDRTKYETLKGAIQEGFRQASGALGGELPEVSQKTYELVMQKLDAWRDEI